MLLFGTMISIMLVCVYNVLFMFRMFMIISNIMNKTENKIKIEY